MLQPCEGSGLSSLKSSQNQIYESGFNVRDVLSFYLLWVNIPFWVVLAGFNEWEHRMNYSAFCSAKRGSFKYSMKLKNRFYGLARSFKDHQFFHWGDRSLVRSPLLFITLTVDPSLLSLDESWTQVGLELNRFRSNLIRKFGPLDFLRVWESHESGFCHAHALLMFRNRSFEGYFRKGHKNKATYRLRSRSELASIKSAWKIGFSDVQLCSSVASAFRYIGKYVSKSSYYKEANQKGLQTLALCWFFRKRSFSVSGAFMEHYHDLIAGESNSNKEFSAQLRLSGLPIALQVVEWELYGFIKGDVIHWDQNSFIRPSAQEIASLEANNLIIHTSQTTSRRGS